MKKLMLLAVCAAIVLTASVQAGDAPRFTPRTHWAEKAYVDKMIDPPDAFAFQFIGPRGWTQCELTQYHAFTVVVRPDLSGTWVDAACPRHENRADDCYCWIFVPDKATALNYRMLIARFKQGAPPMSEDRIQYRIE